MATLLPSLNDHIRRLARREVRSHTGKSKKAGAQHRRDIAALKRLVRSLVSRLASVERTAAAAAARQPAAAATADSGDSIRFRSDGLRTHRAKLGFSAKDYGQLLGVSGLTIYHWEQGKSKPRRKHLPTIATVRAMGKREALAKLESK